MLLSDCFRCSFLSQTVQLEFMKCVQSLAMGRPKHTQTAEGKIKNRGSAGLEWASCCGCDHGQYPLHMILSFLVTFLLGCFSHCSYLRPQHLGTFLREFSELRITETCQKSPVCCIAVKNHVFLILLSKWNQTGLCHN